MLRYLLSLGTLNRFTMNNKPQPQEVETVPPTDPIPEDPKHPKPKG